MEEVDCREGCIEINTEEKRRVKMDIYQNKNVNEQFRCKMNQNIGENKVILEGSG